LNLKNVIVLVAGYLMELLTDCQLDIKLGLVQTAYANGSSTKYIKETLVNSYI
jgi:phosphoacetylglucosamine mutase